MSNKVDIKKLSIIRDNYPKTWEQMQHKASWEHMCIGAVLNNYAEYIDELMSNEDKTEESI